MRFFEIQACILFDRGYRLEELSEDLLPLSDESTEHTGDTGDDD